MNWKDLEYENNELLEKFEEIVLKNISDKSLNNAWVSAQLSISERKLYQDIQQWTGLSPNLYIRKIKMQKAMEMLKSGHYLKVNEVVSKVGFQKAEYFTRLFKEEFGMTPSEVLKG